MASDLDAVSIIAGAALTSIGAVLSHLLALHRDTRARAALASDERRELLAVVPRQLNPTTVGPEHRIGIDGLCRLTQWSPGRVFLRLRELEASGHVVSFWTENGTEWSVPHPDGSWTDPPKRRRWGM